MLEPVFLQDFRPLNHDTKMFDELGFSATLANVSVTPDPAQGWDLGGRLIRRQTDLLTHKIQKRRTLWTIRRLIRRQTDLLTPELEGPPA